MPYQLEIVDIQGRKVWETSDENNLSNCVVDLTKIQQGSYFCVFKSDGLVEIRKVIVIRD